MRSRKVGKMETYEIMAVAFGVLFGLTAIGWFFSAVALNRRVNDLVSEAKIKAHIRSVAIEDAQNRYADLQNKIRSKEEVLERAIGERGALLCLAMRRCDAREVLEALSKGKAEVPTT